MHNMDTIIGAAWLRAVDAVIGGLETKQKRTCIKQVDKSFGDAIDQFWDSVIDNKIDQNEMYQFAFSFFVRYYEQKLDIES